MFHGFVIFQGCFLRLRYQQQAHDVEDVVVDVWNLLGLWALMRSNHPNSAASQPEFHWRVTRFKETSSSATDVDARPRMLWWCFEILFGGRFLLYQYFWKNTCLWNFVNALKLRHLNQHQVISWMQDLVIDISFDIQTISIYMHLYMVPINSAQKSLLPITIPNGSHPGSLLSTARPFVIGEKTQL